MPAPIEDEVAHFWERVGLPTKRGCREWTGARQGNGKIKYGSLLFHGKVQAAHRVAWKIVFGDPGDKCVLHHCDNPPCVEPSHLFLGTQEENIQDMVRKKRQDTARGEKSGMAKLTLVQVREIKRRMKAGEQPRKIHKEYGVHWSMLYHIAQGRTWRDA